MSYVNKTANRLEQRSVGIKDESRKLETKNIELDALIIT